MYLKRNGVYMLELKNISYEVEDNKEILKDIDLKIDEGFIAITGPNGGGKSTLAKIIAGIVQDNSRNGIIPVRNISADGQCRKGH